MSWKNLRAMIAYPLLIAFPALMAFAAASDLLTMTIPNKVSLILVALFAAVVALGGFDLQAIGLHVAAGLAVLVVTFAFFAFGWIGGGDAKLAAVIALWLGFEPLPDYLMATALGGGALTLAILLLRRSPLPRFARRWTWLARLHDPDCGVPYGIALAAAALLVYPRSDIWLGALSA